MAIKMMLFENGYTMPVMVCDMCGKVMRDASMGTVYWRRPQAFDEKSGHMYDMVLACGSDACQRKAEKGGGNTISTMDLDTALKFLMVNSGLHP